MRDVFQSSLVYIDPSHSFHTVHRRASDRPTDSVYCISRSTRQSQVLHRSFTIVEHVQLLRTSLSAAYRVPDRSASSDTPSDIHTWQRYVIARLADRANVVNRVRVGVSLTALCSTSPRRFTISFTLSTYQAQFLHIP